MEGPWEQRLSLEQPVLVLSQNCTYFVPPPAPSSHHCTLLPAPSQNSCRSWLCWQRLQNLCGDREAVPFLEGKPGGRETLSPAQPCPDTGTRTSQCPGARAIPCWKDPGQGSHQAPPQLLGAREVSPGDSEEKFRLLCPPTGFLAPLNLHNNPSALPWGQWDPCSSRAPCGSRRFLRSAPALALAHANNCTNGSPCTWGLVSARPWSPARARPRPECRGGLRARPECLVLPGCSLTLQAAIRGAAPL